MAKIYIDDVGTKFIIDTGVDLTNATVTKLKLKKPDGSIVEWVASIEGDAKNGKISYATQAGDINLAGIWQLQSYIEFSYLKYNGETVNFIVYEQWK